MVRLIAAAAIHDHDQLTVVHNALTTVDAVVLRRLAGLVTSGNVGF